MMKCQVSSCDWNNDECFTSCMNCQKPCHGGCRNRICSDCLSTNPSSGCSVEIWCDDCVEEYRVDGEACRKNPTLPDPIDKFPEPNDHPRWGSGH